MTPPRSAFGAPPQGGAPSGPAKRLRFSVGSYRASDVTPELKPVPQWPLDASSRLIDRRCGPAEH